MEAWSARGSRRTLGVVVACAAHALVGADGLAVAVALPDLQADLDVAPIDAQWVLSAYGLAFGGALLLGGRLGDLYGRRRVLTWSMALFAAASLLAAAAPSLAPLVAARALQGLAAAGGVPAALALIGSVFPAGPERTRALSLLAAMASVGVMSGLLLGGVVTDLLGWRWVLAMLGVPAAVAAIAAPRVLPEARADHRPRLDVPGALLAAGGMLSLLVGITRIEHDGPAATSTIAALLIGAALLGAFVAWERHRPSPLLRLGLLRIDSLRSATFGAAVNAIAFTALVYMGTLYLQAVLGYRPLEAALALAPVDIVAFAVPLLASGAIARRSPRLVLTAAFGLTAVALTWLARTPVPADYVPDVMAPLLVLGASLSVAFVVLTNESIADVSHDEKGIASGVFETANHLFGGAIGVALYATVVAAAGSGLDDAGGYRAGFLTAAALAALGIVAARGARSGRPSRPAPV